MISQTAKLLFCLAAILLLTKVHAYFPAAAGSFRHFDKLQHALAGIVLVIGFPDGWKKTAGHAILWLLVFNIAWETYESAHAHFYAGAYSWKPFGKKWFNDTWTDIAVTLTAGLLAYSITKNTRK